MTTNNKNTAALIHLSTLSQFFIPFGNYIFPIIIWSTKKKESEFIDYSGKQTLNFQLSILAYSIFLLMISIPLLIYGFVDCLSTNSTFNSSIVIENFNFDNFSNEKITGVIIVAFVAFIVFLFLKLMEFFLIIYAAVKTSNGEYYKYPLSIPFFK